MAFQRLPLQQPVQVFQQQPARQPSWNAVCSSRTSRTTSVTVSVTVSAAGSAATTGAAAGSAKVAGSAAASTTGCASRTGATSTSGAAVASRTGSGCFYHWRFEPGAVSLNSLQVAHRALLVSLGFSRCADHGAGIQRWQCQARLYAKARPVVLWRFSCFRQLRYLRILPNLRSRCRWHHADARGGCCDDAGHGSGGVDDRLRRLPDRLPAVALRWRSALLQRRRQPLVQHVADVLHAEGVERVLHVAGEPDALQRQQSRQQRPERPKRHPEARAVHEPDALHDRHVACGLRVERAVHVLHEVREVRALHVAHVLLRATRPRVSSRGARLRAARGVRVLHAVHALHEACVLHRGDRYGCGSC